MTTRGNITVNGAISNQKRRGFFSRSQEDKSGAYLGLNQKKEATK
jgi:hypothetical protein